MINSQKYNHTNGNDVPKPEVVAVADACFRLSNFAEGLIELAPPQMRKELNDRLIRFRDV